MYLYTAKWYKLSAKRYNLFNNMQTNTHFVEPPRYWLILDEDNMKEK